MHRDHRWLRKPACPLCPEHGDNERLAKNIPGAKLTYFADSGHWPFQEESAAYLAAMRGFLAGLPGR